MARKKKAAARPVFKGLHVKILDEQYTALRRLAEERYDGNLSFATRQVLRDWQDSSGAG